MKLNRRIKSSPVGPWVVMLAGALLGAGWQSDLHAQNRQKGQVNFAPGTSPLGASYEQRVQATQQQRAARRAQGRGTSNANQQTTDQKSNAQKIYEEKLNNANAANQGRGGAATPQQRIQARQRAQTQAARRSAGGRQGAPSGPVLTATSAGLPGYTWGKTISSDALYFSPAERWVEPGQRFATPLVFYNSSGRAIDSLDLWIRYDPGMLQAVSIDTSVIEDAVDGELLKENWAERGYVHIAGEFKRPLTQTAQPLFTIAWRAGDAQLMTTLKIEAPSGEKSGIFEGNVNCLDDSAVGNRGRVTMNVNIGVEDKYKEDPGLLLLADDIDPYTSPQRSERGVHLVLSPKDEYVRPGDLSMIDVAVVNPDVLAFDELRLTIRFDPEVVEILDADEENYISHGINIYDGGFHNAMPFGRHSINHVDSIAGKIEYVVGSGSGPRAYPSGVVARIVYRMKRDAGRAQFWFEGLDPLTGRYLTDVRAYGRSLLGPVDGSGSEALHHTAVRIAPL